MAGGPVFWRIKRVAEPHSFGRRPWEYFTDGIGAGEAN